MAIAETITTQPLLYKAEVFAGCYGYYESKIYSRVIYFSAIFVSPITAIVDGLIGIVTIPRAIFTLRTTSGRSNFLFTVIQLQQSGEQLLALPFTALLKTLNPSNDEKPSTLSSIPEVFKNWGIEKAEEMRNSENLLVRRIASRVTYFMILIGLILLKTLGIGVAAIAVPLSLLSFGNWSRMNAVAISALKFPTIIHDIFYFTVKTLNPWAGWD